MALLLGGKSLTQIAGTKKAHAKARPDELKGVVALAGRPNRQVKTNIKKIQRRAYGRRRHHS